ncbi:hypothetical protein BDQ12DRAFT_649951 [Crucibulum laeve]|uniref:Short-chain dehydrogenase n=1 Tax=Crucibulum laeve TaxID=68775 RepID=A0A5C3M276_9AGAR|nr:hypothetical protein BDQ12DRAFT_649951 [Crucibulum laeve]
MAKLSWIEFARGQWMSLPPVEVVDLTGKTVMVVGANAGIGFEATKHFARMNPDRIIFACRSRERGAAAVERLRNEADYSKAELWILDLCKFSSVKEFADKFEKDGGRLDILLENAAMEPRLDGVVDITEDGWESTVQVNDLSLSLLALRLLPRMVETARKYSTTPRLVLVSSEVHYLTRFNKAIEDAGNPLRLLGSKSYSSEPGVITERYNQTKLINVFFTRALGYRLSNAPIIVNTVNPGFCISELRKHQTGVTMWLLEKLLARTAEQGSRQLVWAAVGGEESRDALRGAYISIQEVCEPSDYVISENGKKMQDKLWDNLIEELSEIDSKVKPIVAQHLSAVI